MSSLKKYDLLICDERDYIPLETKGTELLFQVITDYDERKNLIITINLEFDKWNNIFLDKKLTVTIIDRIIHHSHLTTFSGENY